MKQLFVTLGITLISLLGYGQTTLTERTHGLLPGNPNPMILTSFSDPGMAGEHVQWDFSALPQIAPFKGDVIQADAAPSGMQQANTCLLEDDLHAFMRTSRNALEVLGLTGNEGRMERLYDTPVVKMQYPFGYGQQFSGETAGIQRYSNGYAHAIRMHYDVVADAHGTLILPGTTLKNALRVVTTQIVRYGKEESAPSYTVITYRWYVQSHRFPVLSLIFERRSNGELAPLKGAYNPIVELPAVSLSQHDGQGLPSDGQVAEINARPNPFANELTVTYSLTGRANVTIALYDIRGMLARTLMQGTEMEGRHEKSYGNHVQNLPAGQYILRVEANGSVLTQQLLKVN